MKKTPALPTAGRTTSRRKLPAPMDDVLASKVLTLAHLIGRSATALYREVLGMPLTSSRMISTLGGQAPMTLNELAARSGIDKSQLSRGVSDLVDQGIVTRRASENDSRAVQIELSSKGLTLYNTLAKHARKRNEALLEGLSDTKRQQLMAMLDQVTEHAHALLAEQEAAR